MFDFIFNVIFKNNISLMFVNFSFLNRFFVSKIFLHFDPQIVVYFKDISQRFRFTHKVFYSLKVAD